MEVSLWDITSAAGKVLRDHVVSLSFVMVVVEPMSRWKNNMDLGLTWELEANYLVLNLA